MSSASQNGTQHWHQPYFAEGETVAEGVGGPAWLCSAIDICRDNGAASVEARRREAAAPAVAAGHGAGPATAPRPAAVPAAVASAPHVQWAAPVASPANARSPASPDHPAAVPDTASSERPGQGGVYTEAPRSSQASTPPLFGPMDADERSAQRTGRGAQARGTPAAACADVVSPQQDESESLRWTDRFMTGAEATEPDQEHALHSSMVPTDVQPLQQQPATEVQAGSSKSPAVAGPDATSPTNSAHGEPARPPARPARPCWCCARASGSLVGCRAPMCFCTQYIRIKA